jgi:hypothetical protein
MTSLLWIFWPYGIIEKTVLTKNFYLKISIYSIHIKPPVIQEQPALYVRNFGFG